eukprot:6263081-Prymnesium_polylepis.1
MRQGPPVAQQSPYHIRVSTVRRLHQWLSLGDALPRGSGAGAQRCRGPCAALRRGVRTVAEGRAQRCRGPCARLRRGVRSVAEGRAQRCGG